jgi:hypothetical protein
MRKIQMNERIEKLAVEARQYAFGEVENSQDPTEWSTKYYNEMFEQKFAELIVRECMRMCEVTEMSFVTHDCDVEASGAITVKQFIAEHFGVEE